MMTRRQRPCIAFLRLRRKTALYGEKMPSVHSYAMDHTVEALFSQLHFRFRIFRELIAWHLFGIEVNRFIPLYKSYVHYHIIA